MINVYMSVYVSVWSNFLASKQLAHLSLLAKSFSPFHKIRTPPFWQMYRTVAQDRISEKDIE